MSSVDRFLVNLGFYVTVKFKRFDSDYNPVYTVRLIRKEPHAVKLRTCQFMLSLGADDHFAGRKPSKMMILEYILRVLRYPACEQYPQTHLGFTTFFTPKEIQAIRSYYDHNSVQSGANFLHAEERAD